MILEFAYKISARYYIFIRSMYSQKVDRDSKVPGLVISTVVINTHSLLILIEAVSNYDFGLRRIWMDRSGLISILSPAILIIIALLWVWISKKLGMFIPRNRRFHVIRSLSKEKSNSGLAILYVLGSLATSFVLILLFANEII